MGDRCVVQEVCLGAGCASMGRPTCATISDCPAGHLCYEGGCTLMAPRNCEDSYDCGEPALCREAGFSTVRSVCLCADGECPTGQSCFVFGLMTGDGLCLDPSVRREVSGGCPNGSACVDGFCSPPTREVPHGEPCGATCPPGEYCDRVLTGCSGAFLGGACVDVPHSCPPTDSPVCGCDGVTYENDCERIKAGVAQTPPGPCGEF